MIRAKWSMDGAKTLSEAAKALRDYADELLKLERQGWQLVSEINEDYGHIEKPRAKRRKKRAATSSATASS